MQQINFWQDQEPQSLSRQTRPFKTQLLKWIGSKQRVAHKIIDYFPRDFNTYYEPFLGSGAVLGTLMPKQAVGSDIFEPLMQIWIMLKNDPETLKNWYEERYNAYHLVEKREAYEAAKLSYNINPNGADLLFLSRSCYGGVMRFRKKDGFMSTPVGVHDPIQPFKFMKRVDQWHKRIRGTEFVCADFEKVMSNASQGDMVYCDPPYIDTQKIIYRSQMFDMNRLLDAIKDCKRRGVFVALSIDGSKKNGNRKVHISIPDNLFEREIYIGVGRSMLRRFQMEGQSLESEMVTDRLLLTY